MKRLYIIRHAKSSWDDDGLSDFDRPLNDRGKRDAPRMGKRLKEKDVHPNVVVSSAAKRAMSTAKRIAEILHYPEANIVRDKALYHASESQILSVLRSIRPGADVVVVVGHNPGLTDFANSLSQKKWVTDNIPTCGIAAFELPIERWTDLEFETGKLLFFDFPKSRED